VEAVQPAELVVAVVDRRTLAQQRVRMGGASVVSQHFEARTLAFLRVVGQAGYGRLENQIVRGFSGQPAIEDHIAAFCLDGTIVVRCTGGVVRCLRALQRRLRRTVFRTERDTWIGAGGIERDGRVVGLRRRRINVDAAADTKASSNERDVSLKKRTEAGSPPSLAFRCARRPGAVPLSAIIAIATMRKFYRRVACAAWAVR